MKQASQSKRVVLAAGLLGLSLVGCSSSPGPPDTQDTTSQGDVQAADLGSIDDSIIPDGPHRLIDGKTPSGADVCSERVGETDCLTPNDSTTDIALEDATPHNALSDADTTACTTFEEAIQPIFDAHCTACHNGASELDLTAGSSIGSLIGTPSAADAALILVVPGDAEASYLINKLGPSPLHGLPMPLTGPTPGSGLEPSLVTLIADWIDAGATDGAFGCGLEDAGVTDAWWNGSDANKDVPNDNDEGPDEGGNDSVDDIDVKAPCDPPLQVSALPEFTATFTYHPLHVSGGSGDYSVSLLWNASGAQVNSSTLGYLSGGKAGKDVIGISDVSCDGIVQTTTTIVPDPVLSPSHTILPSGHCLSLSTTGGSGQFSYAILSQNPAGTIDATGLYTAAWTDGEDLIEVKDTLTGRVAHATIEVSTSATFQFEASHYWVPTGGTLEFNFDVGTGSPSLTLQGKGGYTLDGSTLLAQSPGQLTVTAHEGSVGCPNDPNAMTATAALTIVDALTLPSEKWGDSQAHAFDVLSPGDITGDGLPDAIISDGGASLKGEKAGMVSVYAGTQDGLHPSPEMSIAGTMTEGRFGESLAIGDLTGDGFVDLVVGAPGQPVAGAESGAVYVFPGTDEKLFDTESMITLQGAPLDQFGTSVAVCDFNGDGFDDLAVGAPTATSTSPWVLSRGYVALYLGGPDGIASYADEILWSVLPVGGQGSWTAVEQTRSGTSMGAGDFDGDGLCDLVVATESQTELPDAPLYEGGTLLLYRGHAIHGLLGTPHRVWRTLYPPGLGDDVLLADLNGDDADELIVSHRHWEWESPKTSPDILIFVGEVLPDEPEAKSKTTASASWVSDSGSAGNVMALRIAIGDITGDGLPDLVHTHSESFLDLAYHEGIAEGFFEVEPSGVIEGTKETSGSCIGVMEDVTADGLSELLVCENGGSTQPDALGGIILTSLAPGAEAMNLTTGSLTAGSRIGSSLAAVDVDGNGEDELIVGAPNGYLGPPTLTQSGVVYLLATTPNGVEPAPLLTVAGPDNQSESRLGRQVRGAGDFDGDGTTDLLIVNPTEEKPTAAQWPGWPTSTDNLGLEACDEGVSSAPGAVHVYTGIDGATLNPIANATIYPNGTATAHGAQDIVQTLTVSGDFDFDGDGLDDVALGRPRHPSVDGEAFGGIVSLIRGRPLGEKTRVICQADTTLHAGDSTWLFGNALSPIEDLDGDGCDELAIGSPGSAVGSAAPQIPWDGGVGILFGFGPKCASAQPRYINLVVPFPMSGFGTSLDGSHDIDGDGLPDLLVGAPLYLVGKARFGAVLIISSAQLKALTPTLLEGTTIDGGLVSHELPIAFSSPTFLVSPVSGSGDVEPMFSLPLSGNYEDTPLFGLTVSFVSGLGSHGTGVAVGIPKFRISPTHDSGQVRTFAWSDTLSEEGKHLSLHGIFAGQTWKAGARLGQSLANGSWGGSNWLVVGAPMGNPMNVPGQVDNGAVYTVPITPAD